MPPERQIGVRGRVIKSQTREVIANVLKFMKEEATRGSPIIPVTHYKQRLLEATGISDKIYRDIVRDMKLIETGQLTSFTAPTGRHKHKLSIEAMDEEINAEEINEENTKIS